MRVNERRLWFVLAFLAISTASYGSGLEHIPSALRARGGLCVIVGGAEDIGPALDLLESGPWVIHWLDARPEAVESARSALRERRVYGRVSVERWDSDNLPYTDNLVTLMVVRDAAQAPDRDEALRALAPEGSLFHPAEDGFAQVDKTRPPEMGDWTHPWHGPDGSLLSNDRALEPPNAFQWIAGPSFPFAHRKNSAGVILSAGGRMFAINQNVPENIAGGSRNHLVARDAFSGVVLWSKPWEGSLSRGHAFAVHEAIVATDERLYVSRRDEVGVLDAANGEVIETWEADGTPTKLLLSEGLLVVQTSGSVSAYDVTDGSRVWVREGDDPDGTLARDGRIFYLEGTRERDGLWRHTLTALALRDGAQLWQQPVQSKYGARNTAVLRLHFAGDGMVCLIERTLLRFLSAEDGRELWHLESEAEARGSGSMDSRQVGHFFGHGKVWVRAARARGGREAPEHWKALAPLTGETIREVNASGPQGVISSVNKVSCQPLTATERFVLDARLSTIWDFEEGYRHGYKFARGGCMVGMVPANGLAYVPPNACGCLAEQLRGNLAVVHTRDEGLRSNTPGPLERGPAYGQATATEDAGAAESWPMYRGDAARAAHMPGRVSASVSQRWEAAPEPEGTDPDGEWLLRIGRPLSPPVVSNGLVALAEPQSHQVIALDADTGAERWRFTAGARVTTPPAFHRGLALFGAHDGYVYALRASDGELAWRRRVAPSDRRIMAYGQLESAWPVEGGVLIHDGVALAAAGRAVDADGGLVVRALDPATGEALWSQRVDEGRYGMCDLLVSNGEHVFLMDRKLDPRTGDVTGLDFSYGRSDRGSPNHGYPDGIQYLRAGKAGLMDITWTRLAMPLRKGQSTWTYGGSDGEMIAVADGRAYAFRMFCDRDLFWAAPRIRGGGVVEALPVQADAFSDHALPADGWRFRLDPDGVGRDEAWFAPDLEDAEWRDDMPIETGWLAHLDEPYQGAGWYRRVIDAPEFAEGTPAFLRFEGVDEEAWLWVNGEFAGSHELGTRGWDLPFEIDVTEHLQPGQRNHIAVRAKNTVGDGGIWRSIAVRLYDQEPVQAEEPDWIYELPEPAQVEAMLATDGTVFIAGPNSRSEPEGEGFLRAISRRDGRQVGHISLPVAPVHDGMAAANGSLFVVLRDGRVLRLGAD